MQTDLESNRIEFRK